MAEVEKMPDQEEDMVLDEADTEQVDDVVEEASENVVDADDKAAKQARIPLSRVRHVMKLDSDCNAVNKDAVFLISKATELFIESLACEAYAYTTLNRKKTIARNDVMTAVDTVECLAFLEGAIED